MLNILIPSNHDAERKYILEVLLQDFLGLDIHIVPKEDQTTTQIQLENSNLLILEEHFFSQFTGLGYLNSDSIPKTLSYFHRREVPFLPEENLPILYGRPFLSISSTIITCGADLFAAAYFMLTRWEEYVRPERDAHGRFPFAAALACRFDFHHRPIVNEYVEFLWAMLLQLGYEGKRKERKFEVVVTHDVDVPLFWKHPAALLKKIGGDILKRRSLESLLFTCQSYQETVLKGGKDPYDTFDFLMDVSEAHNLTSRFYFLVGGKTRYDKGYLPPSHPFIQSLFKKIESRGHQIGFHPSYDTFHNPTLFKQELEELKRWAPQEIKEGRQHFLRFEVPNTWEIWEANGLEKDSSVYFAEKVGFRCGTCYEFRVFNFLKRKALTLKELPLTAMEVSWAKNGAIENGAQQLSELKVLKKTANKFRGSLMILWHNSTIKIEGGSWKHYYSNLITTLVS